MFKIKGPLIFVTMLVVGILVFISQQDDINFESTDTISIKENGTIDTVSTGELTNENGIVTTLIPYLQTYTTSSGPLLSGIHFKRPSELRFNHFGLQPPKITLEQDGNDICSFVTGSGNKLVVGNAESQTEEFLYFDIDKNCGGKIKEDTIYRIRIDSLDAGYKEVDGVAIHDSVYTFYTTYFTFNNAKPGLNLQLTDTDNNTVKVSYHDPNCSLLTDDGKRRIIINGKHEYLADCLGFKTHSFEKNGKHTVVYKDDTQVYEQKDFYIE